MMVILWALFLTCLILLPYFIGIEVGRAQVETCKVYVCPQTGETECPAHGGFNNCCAHPRCPGNRDADRGH